LAAPRTRPLPRIDSAADLLKQSARKAGADARMYPVDNLYRGWRLRPDAVAIEDGARGLTYAELVARVDALAAALQERLPAPQARSEQARAEQARVGICGYNTIEHVVAILAVYAAGHTWVALNPRNGKPELDAIIGSNRV